MEIPPRSPQAAQHLATVQARCPVSDPALGHRLLARYHEAADTVFMDGSTPWEVDEAMVGAGFARGPFEAQDIEGIDLAYNRRKAFGFAHNPARRHIPLVDRMLELGKLGRKTGAGWYRYPGGNGKVEDPIVADLALEECHFSNRTRTDYSAAGIRERLVMAVVNEACLMLSEGIDPAALDLASVTTVGFPEMTGGVLYLADGIGVTRVIAALEALAQEEGDVWACSPHILHCAAIGGLLHAPAG